MSLTIYLDDQDRVIQKTNKLNKRPNSISSTTIRISIGPG